MSRLWLLLALLPALLIFEQCELPVFADGFESGDTSHWSLTVP